MAYARIHEPRNNAGAILALFFFVFAFIAGAIGWVMNIISLFNLEGITGETILRVAGIFIAPLGAILGYF